MDYLSLAENLSIIEGTDLEAYAWSVLPRWRTVTIRSGGRQIAYAGIVNENTTPASFTQRLADETGSMQGMVWDVLKFCAVIAVGWYALNWIGSFFTGQ